MCWLCACVRTCKHRLSVTINQPISLDFLTHQGSQQTTTGKATLDAKCSKAYYCSTTIEHQRKCSRDVVMKKGAGTVRPHALLWSSYTKLKLNLEAKLKYRLVNTDCLCAKQALRYLPNTLGWSVARKAATEDVACWERLLYCLRMWLCAGQSNRKQALSALLQCSILLPFWFESGLFQHVGHVNLLSQSPMWMAFDSGQSGE